MPRPRRAHRSPTAPTPAPLCLLLRASPSRAMPPCPAQVRGPLYRLLELSLRSCLSPELQAGSWAACRWRPVQVVAGGASEPHFHATALLMTKVHTGVIHTSWQPLPLSGHGPCPRVCSLTFAGHIPCSPHSRESQPSAPSARTPWGTEPGLRAQEMLPTRDPATKGTTQEHRGAPGMHGGSEQSWEPCSELGHSCDRCLGQAPCRLPPCPIGSWRVLQWSL